MKQSLQQKSLQAFTIIEMMIAIFVFTLGLISIYGILISSLHVSSYNENALIASQLARQEVEKIKNIRDSNYENIFNWDKIDDTHQFSEGVFTMHPLGESFIFDPVASFVEGKNHISDMQSYRLCLSGNYYDVCSGTSGEKKTSFYRYIAFEKAQDDRGNDIPDTWKVRVKVIWDHYGYHEYEIQTLLSDWRRI